MANQVLTARKVSNMLKKASFTRSTWERVSRTTGFDVEEVDSEIKVYHRLSPSTKNFMSSDAQQENAIKKALHGYRDALQAQGIEVTVSKDQYGYFLTCKEAVEAAKE